MISRKVKEVIVPGEAAPDISPESVGYHKFLWCSIEQAVAWAARIAVPGILSVAACQLGICSTTMRKGSCIFQVTALRR